MKFSELIQKRQSVRAYKPDPVEEEKLQQVLEAARLAPTAANRQPVRVVVIKTAGREAELGRIYGAEWFVKAPYVLCVCGVPGDAWTRRQDGKCYVDVDAAIVMDHIVMHGDGTRAGHLLDRGLQPRCRARRPRPARRRPAAPLHTAGLSR